MQANTQVTALAAVSSILLHWWQVFPSVIQPPAHMHPQSHWSPSEQRGFAAAVSGCPEASLQLQLQTAVEGTSLVIIS